MLFLFNIKSHQTSVKSFSDFSTREMSLVHARWRASELPLPWVSFPSRCRLCLPRCRSWYARIVGKSRRKTALSWYSRSRSRRSPTYTKLCPFFRGTNNGYLIRETPCERQSRHLFCVVVGERSHSDRYGVVGWWILIWLWGWEERSLSLACSYRDILSCICLLMVI